MRKMTMNRVLRSQTHKNKNKKRTIIRNLRTKNQNKEWNDQGRGDIHAWRWIVEDDFFFFAAVTYDIVRIFKSLQENILILSGDKRYEQYNTNTNHFENRLLPNRGWHVWVIHQIPLKDVLSKNLY